MTKRMTWLDFLRILALFLVIVNHTNSLVFKASSPKELDWWLSIVWYYLSKTAVPLFVMISGACLLEKQDSYKRIALRIGRILIALLLFSYVYYLIGVAQAGWNWRAALGFKSFLLSIWQSPITDSFWYLYFYIGLLVMLPLLQRLAHAMQKRDLLYLMGVSFTVNALWPLLTHYVPELALPAYFDVPLFASSIGLFFAGLYLRRFPPRRSAFLPVVCVVLMLAASTLLTRLEVDRVASGAKYWFMDERTAPSILTILCAISVARIAQVRFAAYDHSKATSRWTVLGACAFGGYLLQDLAIAETRYRLFVPMCGLMDSFIAGLLWSLLVFVVVVAVTWLLRKLPGLRKLL